MRARAEPQEKAMLTRLGSEPQQLRISKPQVAGSLGAPLGTRDTRDREGLLETEVYRGEVFIFGRFEPWLRERRPLPMAF